MQPLSRSTAKITAIRDTVTGGSASGFFYKHEERMFLVTNWHVVTGVDTNMLKTMDPTGFIPTSLKIHAKILVPVQGGGQAVRSNIVTVPLFFQDKPLWLEHSERHKTDVVALRFEPFEKIGNLCINSLDHEPRLTVAAGLDCFIVGYPEGLSGPSVTPIWKRGSIATEPHPKYPYFLIDSATRAGMSGAPVIARHSGFLGFQNDGEISDDSVIGTTENFIGIYSGRLGDDALGFQLGKVWNASLIEEIFARPLEGLHPLL